MVVKTYRGLLADGAQDKIPLSTRDGSVGYRIIKLESMNHNPGAQLIEGVMKVYKEEQTTVDGIVNFTDNSLIAADYHIDNDSTAYATSEVVIFDKEIFNQDIFITFKDISTGQSMNYYLELEQMKLDQTQNMSATLKAIRGSAVD